MSLNKKVLAAAIVGGLFAGSAHAAVNISADTVTPIRIAQEVNFAANNTLEVANVDGSLTLQTETNYAFSEGEVRYARLECTANVLFPAGVPAPTIAGGGAAIGNVNGLGTNAINFSITATAPAGIPNDAVLSIAGDRVFTNRDNSSCTYSLYDQPSQAAAGGTTGRIATEQGNYATFVTSYAYDNTVRNAVASVEADPSFTSFLVGGGTTAGVADLGQIEFNVRGALDDMGTTPVAADGEVITLAEILGTNTSHVVSGDFSAAANANGSFTGDALTRVYLSTGGTCAAEERINATALTANSATFRTNAAVDARLCFAPRATVAIPASDYSVRLAPVSNTGYTASAAGPAAVGSITRDGTQLQAPLAQIPEGWFSRLVLTNTGSIPRTYTISVMTEENVTVATGTLTGTVPANGTKVIDDVKEIFTGNNRATLNVNVAGPNDTIQGLYQIVNPGSGSISNHVLVRPGSN